MLLTKWTYVMYIVITFLWKLKEEIIEYLLTNSGRIFINWTSGRRDVRMNIAILKIGISQGWDIFS